MKIFTKSTILALILSNSFLFVNSQSIEQRQKIVRSSDLEMLNSLKNQYAEEFAANYAKALQMARINNWPLRINKPNGDSSELQGVNDDGTPIYYTTNNAGSAKTSRADRLYPGGTLGLNITGLGMFAGVWEELTPRTDHLDLTGRIYDFDGSAGAVGDHATHVTGTIISSGQHSGSGLPGRGIAYEATAWTSNWTNDLSEMAAAASQGMLLSNHSYGLDAQGGSLDLKIYGSYILQSKQIDDVAFAAPYYQPVVAAGNSRDESNQVENPTKGGHDLLSKYGTSKNAIVVAAVLAVPVYTGPGSVRMSNFSSWGPSDDNRVKPDISDKGVQVYSTIPNTTTSYGIMQGTSMASPGVTGSLLLLQQHYGNLYGNVDGPSYMKAATLRGLMCHTADEAGDFDGPDSKFGWGLINDEKAAQTITKSTTGQSVLAELTLNQGETYTKNISVTGSEPLIATIAWTDKGGVPNTTTVDLSTPALVNNLDIRVVKAGGEVNFPWKLNDVVDFPSVKEDNNVDNIEKVQVDNPSGDYTIVVTHKGILAGGKQDFSLIVTGSDLNLRANENDFKAFNVWPNPAKDLLNISLQSDSGEDTYVSLYDVQGKRVLYQKLEGVNDYMGGSLILNGVSDGLYMVNINQGTKQSTKKIMIRK